jgi:IS5 family transposase
LILDVVIETGIRQTVNGSCPERHIALYGKAPRQAAADGGFATGHNLSQAKARGVHDVAFHKKAGLLVRR